jgi:alginate O-acetyltransferase complex protein AlgI
MLFNSFEFLIFLPTVFCLYWFVFNKNLKAQNLLLFISSYIFYGWWDYRFLSLIFFSTVVDYFVGLKIHHSKNKKIKKFYLWISILFNIGLLGFFKYFNFFIDSWIDLLSTIGYESQSTWTLNVILPVGISFYTFQTMSYSLDIYHGKLKPTKDFISFASFVSFFPQLVAGPIERASNLLPQILKSRKFKAKENIYGIKLIIYGLFKKIAVADNCAFFVNDIFNNYESYEGLTLVLGAIYFSFQIYCDFSGYSDIAIGTAKLFGFDLMLNFKFPYFSRDIGEFWRRWHISLSTWFRDYLYIPMGGSRGSRFSSIRNIFIIFIISGFWHGANWTFLFWGFIHAILYLPLFVFDKNRIYLVDINYKNNVLIFGTELFRIIKTFTLVTIAWVFFRSDSLFDAFVFLWNIISKPLSTGFIDYRIQTPNSSMIFEPIILIIILLIFEIRLYRKQIFNDNYLIILIFLTYYLGNFINTGEFIYFQF